MKHIILVTLFLVTIAFCDKPTGRYDLLAHATFGSAPTSVLLSSGIREGNRCHYVGKISLPAHGDYCPAILVLHLYSIRGGKEGLQCGYDLTIFDDVVFENGALRSHCSDILVVDHGTYRVLGQYDFTREDNQADYWNNEFHCGFMYDIEPEFFGNHPELQSQILYRLKYDWDAREPYAR